MELGKEMHYHPHFFAIYINDLLLELNSIDSGISIPNQNISCPAYADDIVIIASSPSNLNILLKTTEAWCKNWLLELNIDKTQIVHFRPNRIPRTGHKFHMNNQQLINVPNYKYLGVLFDEHLTFEHAVKTLSTAAGRALGSVCSKFKLMTEMGFNTFNTLCNNCVIPVMNYGFEIWGCNKFIKAQSVHNRATHFYSGVHKFASNHAIQGDIAWINCNTRWSINIVRYWNRLIKMENSRLTKKSIQLGF